jgi:hypothetical protein
MMGFAQIVFGCERTSFYCRPIDWRVTNLRDPVNPEREFLIDQRPVRVWA